MRIEEEALRVAKLAAKRSGKKILPLFGKVLAVREKESPTDLCSEADLLAEKIVYATLSKEFPDFNYFSEEHELVDKDSEYTWVIDPLDGSIPFISGLEYWGISIGLLKGNNPITGVIYVPRKDWLVFAEEGKGAFLNGRPIIVSKNNHYDKAIIGFDLGHRGFRKKDLLKNIVSQVEKVRYMPSFACATFGQVLVATGVYDAYLHHRAFPWDFCAGAIIVQEAGGKVTDHRGNPLDWTKKDNLFLLASNGLLHEEIIRIINRK